MSSEAQQAFQLAFARLPRNYRLLLNLRHLQALTYDEIAAVTGLPLGTVKTGIYRSRRLLRESLQDEHLG